MGSSSPYVHSGVKLRLWSDCADVQTDLDLRCMQVPTCTFYWLPAPLLFCNASHLSAASWGVAIE